MKKAFTLSEILITLVVVGTVAAMTLPTLINNISDRKWETQRKKAMSVVANGYKKMMADEGVFDVQNLEMMNCTDPNCFMDIHKKYFKIVSSSTDGKNLPEEYSIPKEYQSQAGKKVSQFSWEDDFTTVVSSSSVNTYNPIFSFITTDGMGFGFYSITSSGASAINSANAFAIAADVNSEQKVNSVKKDLYLFRVAGNDIVTDVTDELLNNSSGCSPLNKLACKNRMSCNQAGGWWNPGSPPPGHSYSSWTSDPSHGRCM